MGFGGSRVELRRLRRLRSACRAAPGTACCAGGRVKSRRPDYGLARRALLAYERRQERKTLGIIRIWGGGENQEDFGTILKREHLTVDCDLAHRGMAKALLPIHDERDFVLIPELSEFTTAAV